jgi:hypothetical protein
VIIVLALLMDLNQAHIAHVGSWYGKPPLQVHSFDVTLQNPSAEPRWILLPRVFGQGLGKDEAELQIYRLSAKSTLVIGISGNFQGVKLPGHGVVTLRGLRIESWWEKSPKTVEVEVLVARTVTLAGVPLLALESSGDVKAPRDAADDRAQKFLHPNGPVAVDVESRYPLTAPLK